MIEIEITYVIRNDSFALCENQLREPKLFVSGTLETKQLQTDMHDALVALGQGQHFCYSRKAWLFEDISNSLALVRFNTTYLPIDTSCNSVIAN